MCQAIYSADSCSGSSGCSSQNISGYLYSTAHQCNPVRRLNYTLQCEVKCICRPVNEKFAGAFLLYFHWLFWGFFSSWFVSGHCMSAQS